MSFVTSHGVPIYYERHGQGPAVVFCHGAGSNAATWWQQIPHFSRHFCCIAIDHRCFGRSVAPTEAFRPELFVDDLLAVLDAERIERASLVCQSLGGMAGLRLALWHPERVRTFVCCDSPLAIDHPQMLANVRRFLASVEATELEDRALGRAFVAAHPELAFLYGRINQFNRAVYAPQDDGGWGRRLAGLFDPGYLLPTDALRTLAATTLFVVGSEDPVVTPPVVRELAALMPRSQVLEVPGAGHSPYFEQPALFNSAVLEFLLRHAC
jgi:pimeloyl-ACP methyl ester carboxylesterase